MFVASHKHGHLKGLIGQGGPLLLQDVLVLAEEPLDSTAALEGTSVANLTKSVERSSHQFHSICRVSNVRSPFHG